MALREALAPRLARSPRVDLLVPVSQAPTVGELLQVCAQAQRAAPGARCVLGGGEIAGYQRQLQPREPIRAGFEVIEGDGDEGLP